MKVYDILTLKSLDYSDLRLLVQHVLNFSRVEIVLQNDYILTKSEESLMMDGIARLINKEPIHYIIGYKEFYSHKFKVNKHTLIPRPETELLVDLVLSRNIKIDANILDLGTGSGCIAISCFLQRPSLNVTAVDKYLDTLNVAIENGLYYKTKIKFILSNWYSNLTHNQKFDIIVSNPPYIDANDLHLQNLSYEPIYALTDGSNGLSHIEYIIRHAKNYLNSNGLLMLEHGYDQSDWVQGIFYQNNFINIETIYDLAQNPRVTLGYYM